VKETTAKKNSTVRKQQHRNNLHTNIKFKMEIETNGSLPFLDEMTLRGIQYTGSPVIETFTSKKILTTILAD
jgi:hypothetical protein